MKYLGKQQRSAVKELDLIPWRGGRILVTLNCEEFTSHCPVTGQPDFAKIKIEYFPNKYIAETKSVKLFMWQYRDQAEFNEVLVDKIKNAFVSQLKPAYLKVTGEFAIRGGIWVKAEAIYRGV